MAKRDINAVWKVVNIANKSAARKARINAEIITLFSEYLSINIPEGIDITPYATKKEKGKNPAMPMLRSKLVMISGTSGPRMLVKKEITAKIKKISATIIRFGFISLNLQTHLTLSKKWFL